MDNFWCGYRFIPPQLSTAAAGNYSLTRFSLPRLVLSLCLFTLRLSPRPLIQTIRWDEYVTHGDTEKQRAEIQTQGWIWAQTQHFRAVSDLWLVVRVRCLYLSTILKLQYLKCNKTDFSFPHNQYSNPQLTWNHENKQRFPPDCEKNIVCVGR